MPKKAEFLIHTNDSNKVTIGSIVIHTDDDGYKVTDIVSALNMRWGHDHVFETSVDNNICCIVWGPKSNISPTEIERLGCAMAAYVVGFQDSRSNSWSN